MINLNNMIIYIINLILHKNIIKNLFKITDEYKEIECIFVCS